MMLMVPTKKVRMILLFRMVKRRHSLLYVFSLLKSSTFSVL